MLVKRYISSPPNLPRSPLSSACWNVSAPPRFCCLPLSRTFPREPPQYSPSWVQPPVLVSLWIFSSLQWRAYVDWVGPAEIYTSCPGSNGGLCLCLVCEGNSQCWLINQFKITLSELQSSTLMSHFPLPGPPGRSL